MGIVVGSGVADSHRITCLISLPVGSEYDAPGIGLSTSVRPASLVVSMINSVQLRPSGGAGTVNGVWGCLTLTPPDAHNLAMSRGPIADVDPATENVAAIAAPKSAQMLRFIAILIPTNSPS
jgi:hypothetical protein